MHELERRLARQTMHSGKQQKHDVGHARPLGATPEGPPAPPRSNQFLPTVARLLTRHLVGRAGDRHPGRRSFARDPGRTVGSLTWFGGSLADTVLPF